MKALMTLGIQGVLAFSGVVAVCWLGGVALYALCALALAFIGS